ncbi:MAG: patatin-like phospholipase family protein [Halofilum sp. (in: g-proteobacteria)]|nr:patatin-like phospholipase family protein [Halofilum sp. (in: g-proteobacteria)]
MAGGMLGRWRDRTRAVFGRRRFRRPVGLALSGGATLGAAHVGALRALHEAEVPIDYLAGTSIGAVAAALYAFDTPVDDIEEVALEMSWLSISSFSPSRMGLLANRRLGDVLEARIGDPEFDDARIPFAVIATDISTGERVVLREGRVLPAVMASACMPGIFQPIEHDDRLLVDGGLVENLPIGPLRDFGARSIIGIDLNLHREYQRPDDLIDVILNATDIAINHSTRLQVADEIDLLIAPALSSYSRFRSGRGHQLVEEGLRATQKALTDWHGTEERRQTPRE